jgi:phosphopantothenoylcysteine decarboxylase/phosphopantothenate--cysteine ligase
MHSVLEGKRVVLAATGSIAVYKAVDLASKLTQAGAQVDVVMTTAAQKFVTPLTFQAVTGRAVYTDMWATEGSGGLDTHIAHVGLGEGADVIAVVPATAHTLARLAAGLADDLLTVTALAARCPMLVAPAMDGGMYTYPAVVANLATLTERGVVVVEPDEGRFASGLTGKGRLPDTATLIGHIRRVLGRAGPLAGRRVVVTAGGTLEPLDPVRYLTNHSSGKQGYAVAQAALDAGAAVTLISAARGLPVPVGADLVAVDSAADLHAAVMAALPGADALVMAAAVADYRPATRAEQKIKKGGDDADLTLPLARTTDILLAVKDDANRPAVVVGFAAESENLLTNARSKLERKGLDLLVANDITAPDAGFAVDTNRVTLLTPDGGAEALDLQTKADVAAAIVERVAALLG